MKPLLAFTMGDPGGIGPEVAVRALRDIRVRRAARVLIVGDRGTFRRAGWREGLAPLIETAPLRSPAPRRPSAQGGAGSYEALQRALRLASRGLIGGMVTAPISKEAWALAGVPYRDHTEFLRRETSSPRATMMLASGRLKAVLVTRHIPLSEVPRALTARELADAVLSADAALRGGLGVLRPRLGLCALNPHAGDGGLLGREEERLLAPTARALRARGIRLEGPLPADAAWAAHAAGRFDALIALYHDQALIPLKLHSPYGVVNWTIGSPVLRTSPGHGTAFDIAGRGAADPSAMIEAALWAARVAAREA